MEEVLKLSDQASCLLTQILQQLKTNETNWEAVLKTIQRFIFEPTLLDSKLKEIICILEVKLYIFDGSRAELSEVFYNLCKIRGYKAILKYCTPKVENLVILSETKLDKNWKVSFTLLMLLSVQILIPFPLNTISCHLKENVYKLAHEALEANGKEKEAGAVLMSRLLSRSDMGELLKSFIDSCASCLNDSSLLVLNELLRSKKINIEPTLLHYEPTTTLEYRYWYKCLGKLSVLTQSQNCVTEITKLLIFNAKSREPQLRSTIAKQLSKIIKQLEVDSRFFLVELLLNDFEDELTPWEFIHTALLTFGYLALDMALDSFMIKHLVQVLPETLFFEKKLLNRTFGSDIRDASCFVAWAVSRKHANDPLWEKVYQPLVLVALLDGNLSVQKAASAALQEVIGRHPQWTSEYKIQFLETMERGSESVLNFDHSLIPAATAWCWRNLDRCQDLLRVIYKIDEGDISAKVESLKGYHRTYLLGHLLDLRREPLPDVELTWTSFREAEAVLHYLTGLAKIGARVDASIAFAIVSEYGLQSEFEHFMAHVMPSKQVKELCLSNLDNLVVCACVGANEIVVDLQPSIHAFVIGLGPSTRSSELKRALLYSVGPRWRVYIHTIYHCLDDYSKSEQGDVGSWVRFAAVDVLKDDVEFDEAILQRLLRLSGEPNVKVRMASLGILKQINKNIALLEAVSKSSTVTLTAPAAGAVSVVTNHNHQWLHTNDALSYFQLICLYLLVYYKDDRMGKAVWEGLDKSLRTKATREPVMCALIEAFGDHHDHAALAYVHSHSSSFAKRLMDQAGLLL